MQDSLSGVPKGVVTGGKIARPGFEQGAGVIREVVRTLGQGPGVYRMMNAAGDVLYVGKARNLRNRVGNYVNSVGLSNRISRMVAETAAMEVITTQTEVEALLLECNLIKKLTPRYNVLLRDDKSYAFIHLRTNHDVPQLTKHRGACDEGGEYFGPFASAGAVNRTITALQRAFQIRSCPDSIFSARSRPCLQYQIKRCSAPCVGRIEPEAYKGLVDEARHFLKGRSREVTRHLADSMAEASKALDFETAAELRDRIRALAQIQARQDINVAGISDADVIAIHQEGGYSSVQLFFFRGGQNWGNRAYFPSHDRSLSAEEVLGAMIGQFYSGKPPPPLLLANVEPAEAALIAEALSANAGRKVQILVPKRGDKQRLVAHALLNAQEALARRLAETATQARLLDGLAQLFKLDAPPARIEIYDNSHIQGSNAVGAMVVAGPEGFRKNEYRKFNIRGTTDEKPAPVPGLAEARAPYRAGDGDDYAMMREVLTRRFRRVSKEPGVPEGDEGARPDLVLIDGGPGQLAIATQVLADLGVTGVIVGSIAKGPDRNAGREKLYLPDQPVITLEPKDPLLHFLQRLRDEAHRFAIGSHRARRQASAHVSPLDEIVGIGPRRKRALLHHFGSAREVARAGLTDLAAVEGINETVAKKIYAHFRGEG